jgi:predicted nucleotidyltransferase
MLPKSDIVRVLQDFLQGQREVEFAYIFGSVAQGERFEDIDVAVYLNDTSVLADRNTHPYGYESTLVGELTRLLHTDKVDFVVLNNAGPTLFTRAIKGMRIVDRNRNKRIEIENAARYEFIDMEPARRIQDYYLLKKLTALHA